MPDRTKYHVRNYSVPKTEPFDAIDHSFNVNPQIRKQIQYASVVICSNRPAIGLGMSIDEIKYAKSIGKLVVAVSVTENTSSQITNLGIPVIPCRKDSLEIYLDSYSFLIGR